MRTRSLLVIGVLLAAAMLLAGCEAVVPPLTGSRLAEAKTTLEARGLKLGRIAYDTQATGEPGIVVAQSPSGDAKAAAGSAVDVTVSARPAAPATPETTSTQTPPETVPEAGLVQVPDLLKAISEWVTATEPDPHDPKWADKAIAALQPKTAPLGLKVSITWATTAEESEFQRPAAGARVPRGTTVEVRLIGEL